MHHCHRSSVGSHIEVCESEMHQQRVQPCHVVVENTRKPCCHERQFQFQFVRPLCCSADCNQLLVVLSGVALLYSIVALVLTCIYAPHPFFIAVLGFSIIAMLVILSGTLSGNNGLMKLAFVLTSILAFLTAIGAVYCAFYVISNFNIQYDWKWRWYLITMLIAQTIMIFYVIALLYFVVRIISFNRRVREDTEGSDRRIPTWRRY